MNPELAGLAGLSIALYGMTRIRSEPTKGGVTTGLGAGIIAMSIGIVPALLPTLAATAMMAILKDWGNRAFAHGIAIAALVAAMAAVSLWRLTAAIERQAEIDEAREADVIVVLGAAEYRGKPSPVLRARLDHALGLYRKKLAPRILTTGGAGGDPLWTESEVGRMYLSKHGVPVEAIIIEPEGESTVESTTAASEIMRRMNLRSCIVVSDGYHIFRAKTLMANPHTPELAQFIGAVAAT